MFLSHSITWILVYINCIFNFPLKSEKCNFTDNDSSFSLLAERMTRAHNWQCLKFSSINDLSLPPPLQFQCISLCTLWIGLQPRADNSLLRNVVAIVLLYQYDCVKDFRFRIFYCRTLSFWISPSSATQDHKELQIKYYFW